MKTKLTLTISSQLLPEIKHIAVLQGTSLSNLIERAMQEIIGEKQESFAKKWKGKFKTTGRRDKRYEYLAKKYL